MSVELPAGTLFANDFRVVRPLSEGGMGAVFVVEQLSTGAQRALKLMRREIVADAGLRERFLQEARVGARIASDHVVQVIAAGVDPRGDVPWLAMELLVGEEVEQRIKRHGPMSRAEVAEVAKQLGHALSAAHAVGVVHRDLKPNNLFLAQSRTSGAPFSLKVLDFGIAKVVEEAKSTGTMGLGTPLWMAPEQTERKGFVGPGTDLWAFGLITFFILTGRNYWLAASEPTTSVQTLMREMLFEPIVPPSRRAQELGVGHLIPAGFDPWFLSLVERDPARREAQVNRALNGLLSLLGSAPGAAHGAPHGAAFATAVAAPLAFTSFPANASQNASQHQPLAVAPVTSMPSGTGGGGWAAHGGATPAPLIKPPPTGSGPRGRRSALGGIAVAGLALAALGVGGYFVFGDSGSKKKKKDRDDDDDDDKKKPSKPNVDPNAAKAADCEKLAAFQKRVATAADSMEEVDKPTADDLEAFAKKLDGLAKDARELDVTTTEAKSLTSRTAKVLTEYATAARDVSTAIKTQDAEKASAAAERVKKLEAEMTAIGNDAEALCPNLKDSEQGG